MSTRSLRELRFSLVGPGRVGASLARWLTRHDATLVSVAGRGPAASGALASELGGRSVPLDRLDTAGESLLLVAVSDTALDEVAGLLGAAPQAAVALHTCGSRGASALAPLAARGTATGSLHPLFPFPAAVDAPPRELVLAVDGDLAARQLAERLALAWGARAVVVPESLRAVYHLAAVLSAGGIVTLLALAAELVARGGLSADLAPGFAALSRGALEAASRSADPAEAITGPWRRGEVETVARHFAAAARLAPERLALLRELACEAVRQRRRLDPHDEATATLASWLAESDLP